VKQQIEDVIGIDASDAVLISAKTGLNIDQVLEAIVTRLPPPKGQSEAAEKAPLQAMLIDSWYDVYLGVVILVRVVDGTLKVGQRIKFMATGAAYDVDRVGYFTPKQVLINELTPGEVGFITAGVKNIHDTKVGDTITDEKRPAEKAAHRLQAVCAGCVLRPVPHRCRRV
jgi:GTP-binding protein LepA